MKKSKIVVPALGMIALATAASITGTVAWFTANNTVTATGMSVKAKVDASLYIAEGAGVNINSLELNTVALTSGTNPHASADEVRPCEMSNSTGTITVKNATGYSTAPDGTHAGTANAWENIGTLTSSLATDASGKHLEEFVSYGFVTVGRRQTEAASYKLSATATVEFGANSALNGALRLGFIIGNEYFESEDKNATSGSTTFTFNSAQTAALTDNVAYDICVMAWFEGEDSDCTTNNAITLSSNTISWSFTSTDYVAPQPQP